ncbi:MAG: tetratricopeptide repeat protein [Gemmatimonadetes bacterium]|nr:tetratricopeptide repeat protein [Gemmatimonadota bacterium]
MARRPSIAQKHAVRSAADMDDVFVERTLAVSGWAQRNRQVLVFAGILLAAAAAGGLYYLNYRKSHNERAAVELERVEQAAAFGDTATAKVELGRYIETFGNTPYADEARLVLGQLYLQSNQADQAAQVLEPASDLSEPLGRQAAMLLAKGKAQQGQLDEAEALLIRIADRSDLDFQKREALEEAARIRIRLGNLAGAAELYQRILDGMKETESGRGVYEMRLEEIKVQQKTG